MADLIEKAKVIIDMEGDASDKLKKLKSVAEELKQSIRELGKNNPASDQFKKQLKDIEANIKSVRAEAKNRIQVIIDGEMAGKSLRELSSAAAVLRKELRAINPDLAEFAEKSKRLQDIEARAKKLNETIKGTGGFFSKLREEIGAFGMVAASYLGFQFLSSQISNIINKNAKLSDSLADIRRVAGLTEVEVRYLNQQLGKIDTRTGTEALRQIAIVAGKLGVAKGDLAGFTQEVDKLVVTLGDELGNADAVTTTLGKILNVFEGKITAENIAKLGNAFVVLANKGVATGGFMADFTQRLSGIAVAANMSLPATVGLGAGLEELGLKVESSSTAVSKLIVNIGQDIPKAAKIAGATSIKEIEEFTKLFAEKPEQALLKFAAGLSQNKASFGEIAMSFKDAGEEGARVISTLAQLGAKGDFLREKMNDAAEAMKNTAAINAAFAIKNETLGAELDKLGKKFYGFVSNASINSFLTKQVQNVSAFIDALKSVGKFIADHTTLMYNLAVATLLYSGALSGTVASTIASTTAELVMLTVQKAKLVLTKLAISTQAAYITITNLLTGQITLATAAQRLFNAVFAANPLALAIIAISGVVEAIQLYRDNTAEAIKLEKEKIDLSRNLAKVNADLKNSMTDINKQLEDYNKLTPAQRDAIKQTIDLKLKDAQATLIQLEAEQKAILQASTKTTTWQELWNLMKSGGNVTAAAIQDGITAIDNGTEAAGKYSDGIKELAQSILDFTGKQTELNKVQNAERDAMAINTVTIDNYNEKLRLLRIALSAATLGSEDYKRIQEELTKTQDELNKAQGSHTTDDQKKKLAEYQAKVIEMYAKLRNIKAQVIREDEERDLAALESKFKKEREDSIKALNEIKTDKDLSDAQKKAAEAATNKLLLALEDQYQQEKSKLVQKYDQQRIANEYDQDVKNLNQQHDNEATALKNALTNKEITETEFQEKMLELEKKILDTKLKYNQDYFKQSLLNTQSWHDSEKASLDKQLAAGTLTQEKYNEKLQLLEQDTSDAKLKITDEFGKKETAIQQGIADNNQGIYKNDTQHFINSQLAKLQGQLLSAEEENKYSEAALDAKIELIKAKGKIEAEKYKEGSEERKLIELQTNKEIEDATRDHVSNQIQLFEGLFSEFTKMLNNFSASETNRENAMLAADKKRNDDKKKHLKDQLDHKLISQKEYDTEVAKLDDSYEAKRKEIARAQFERQKEAAMAEALINTFVGVTKALSTGIPPWNLVLAALNFSAGMTEVEKIQSEEPPEYGYGRKPQGKGGVPEGPSHNDGGIDLVDNKTGKVVGNMEGREPILSVDTYENNQELVDELVDASMNGGGRTISLSRMMRNPKIRTGKVVTNKFETGRPAYLQPPSQVLNTDRLVETVRLDKQQTVTALEGKVVTNIEGTLNHLNDSIDKLNERLDKRVEQVDQEINQTIGKLNETLANPKPQRTYIVYQDIEDSKAEIDTIRRNAQIGK